MKKLAVIAVCLLAACESVIEVDVPRMPPRLVINALLTPDSSIAIVISATGHILDDHIPSTQDAVPILKDGSGDQIALAQYPIGDPSRQDNWYNNAGGWLHIALQRPVPGMTYTIEVNSPNFDTATASSIVPGKVEIVSARIDSANAIYKDQSEFAIFPVEATFIDAPGTKDYYFPRLIIFQSLKYYDPSIGDTVVNQSSYEVAMSKTVNEDGIPDFSKEEDVIEDTNFDGEQYTVRRYASLPTKKGSNVETVSVQLVLGRADEEYAKYFTSLTLYRGTKGNPLAEPVQVYSNVSGGLGIFTSYSNSIWNFR